MKYILFSLFLLYTFVFQAQTVEQMVQEINNESNQLTEQKQLLKSKASKKKLSFEKKSEEHSSQIKKIESEKNEIKKSIDEFVKTLNSSLQKFNFKDKEYTWTLYSNSFPWGKLVQKGNEFNFFSDKGQVIGVQGTNKVGSGVINRYIKNH